MANKAAVVRSASEPFAGRSILIIEDEYFLADDLANEFTRRGADILGPLNQVADAIALLNSGAKVDGALLDINVRNEWIFPLAEALRERNIPFVFTTGYGKDWLRPEFADVPLCEKPLDLQKVIGCLAELMPRS
jgi:CheY-like chemotaxis protein